MPDGFGGARESFLPLRGEDFDQFRMAATGELRQALDRIDHFEMDPLSDGWAYRRFGEGPIRGIGAIARELPWRWVLWSFPGELSLSDWKRVLRFTRLRIERKLQDPRCLRIEATANVMVPGAAAVLESLGFELEGVMRCYGPRGEAHRLYAIVQEGPHVGS